THAYTLRGPSTKECPKTTPGTRYPHRSVLDTALPVLNSVARHYRPKKTSTYRMVTDRYAAFADYYGVTIVPTRPGRPRDKAAVEL
ncbi:hypothetical protein ACL1IF_14830, partial [Corynebacterium striatum]